MDGPDIDIIKLSQMSKEKILNCDNVDLFNLSLIHPKKLLCPILQEDNLRDYLELIWQIKHISGLRGYYDMRELNKILLNFEWIVYENLKSKSCKIIRYILLQCYNAEILYKLINMLSNITQLDIFKNIRNEWLIIKDHSNFINDVYKTRNDFDMNCFRLKHDFIRLSENKNIDTFVNEEIRNHYKKYMDELSSYFN